MAEDENAHDRTSSKAASLAAVLLQFAALVALVVIALIDSRSPDWSPPNLLYAGLFGALLGITGDSAVELLKPRILGSGNDAKK